MTREALYELVSARAGLSEHEALVFDRRDGKVVEGWEHYEDSQA